MKQAQRLPFYIGATNMPHKQEPGVLGMQPWAAHCHGKALLHLYVTTSPGPFDCMLLLQ